MTLRAIETISETRSAMALWRRIVASQAKKVPGIYGRPDNWLEQNGFWVHFDINSTRTGYWNPCGIVENGRPSRANMIVEINPPLSGKNTNLTGLLAKDESGRTYLCHKGRLHPKSVRIREEDFDRVYRGRLREEVRFTDGKIHLYHIIGCLDDQPDDFSADLGYFVRECHRIREAYISGDANLIDFPPPFSDESTGSYLIPGRKGTIAERYHGVVVNSLSGELSNLGYSTSAARQSEFAPDLYVHEQGSVTHLVEVKTNILPRSIYEAVGQLLLYSSGVPSNPQLILAVPAKVSTQREESLKEIGISVMVYNLKKNKRTVTFPKALQSFFS